MSLGGYFDGGPIDPPEPEPCETCGGTGRVRVDVGAHWVITDCHCDGPARDSRPEIPTACAAE